MDRTERRALRPDRGARVAPPLIALFAVLATGPARADCPVSYFRFGADTPVYSTAAIRDSASGPQGGCGFVEAAWNLGEGTILLDQRPCLSSSSECVVEDSYTVAGLPAGTPVLVFATLRVQGDTPVLCGGTGCSVQGRAVLFSTLASDTRNWQLAGPLDESLGILIPAIAGTAFPIRMELSLPSCGAGSEGVLRGTLTFRMFASAGAVTSCQGYAMPTTPAATASWGTIKARYR